MSEMQPQGAQFPTRNDGASITGGLNLRINPHRQVRKFEVDGRGPEGRRFCNDFQLRNRRAYGRFKIFRAWLELARLSSQASLGMIQRMRPGGTPFCNNHRQASMPVLPDPITAYRV